MNTNINILKKSCRLKKAGLQMNRFINKYWLFFALLGFNVIIFVMVSMILDIRFETNDDVVMCLIANGNYSGSPDFHLVFQNAIWGYLLTILYNWTTSVEWYSLLLSIAHITALTIIVHIIIQKNKDNRLFMISYLLCIYILWIVTIQTFQFTTTSGLLCIAGCLLLIDAANNTKWGGYAAILTSALIRYESTLLVLLLFIPLAILVFKKDWIKYLYIIGAFAIVFSTRVVDRLFYSSPQWDCYYKYNKLRGEINDNPNLDVISIDRLQEIGIDEDDYAMLCDFTPDPQIITLPILKQIHTSIKSTPLKRKLSNVHQLKRYKTPILLLMLLTIFICFSTKFKFEKLTIILWTCSFILLLGMLCLEHTLKNRVFLCALIAILTFFAVTPKIALKNEIVNIATILCIFGFTLKYGYKCYKVNATRELRRELKINMLEDQLTFLETLPNDAYIYTLSLSIEELHPYRIMNFRTKLYPIGWLTAFPYNNVGNSHADLLRPDVYVFMNNNEDTDGIASYLNTKYGVHVSVNKIAQNNKYSIIQLQNRK